MVIFSSVFPLAQAEILRLKSYWSEVSFKISDSSGLAILQMTCPHFQSFWNSRSGRGPENLHFWQVLRECYCCWLESPHSELLEYGDTFPPAHFLLSWTLRERIAPYLVTNLAPFSLDNVHSTLELGPHSFVHWKCDYFLRLSEITQQSSDKCFWMPQLYSVFVTMLNEWTVEIGCLSVCEFKFVSFFKANNKKTLLAWWKLAWP